MCNQKISSMPLASCVTTTYRKFQYLYETLDSIFFQKYPNIELVICDDGSENFPEKELLSYVEKHKKSNIKNVVIEHSLVNHGTVYNCRRCRELASGKYIIGIASDDMFYDSEVIGDVVDYFEKTGANIITCIRQFVDAKTLENISVLPTKKQRKLLKSKNTIAIFNEMASMGFISGANTYYRKEFYNRYSGFDPSYKYIEDYPFFMRVLRKGDTIEFYDRISIKYRHGDGISTKSRMNNEFRYAMYQDRIRYMDQEILPYMNHMEFWRKEQMKVRRRRFEIEQNQETKKLIYIYLKLFAYSPIGTIIQIYYQGRYKIRMRPVKRNLHTNHRGG